MAGLPARFRLQPTDVKAAAMWGVAASTGALYLIQIGRLCLMLRIYTLYLVCLFTFGDVPY
ncbi:hypothetical protein SESBI_39931 [Sesbania bispinosa]|nr:hypothetical protein SESBI_39931 [Sesbania bispinosa]